MLHITMWGFFWFFFQVLQRNLERQSVQLYLADVLFLLHFSLQIHVLDRVGRQAQDRASLHGWDKQHHFGGQSGACQ